MTTRSLANNPQAPGRQRPGVLQVVLSLAAGGTERLVIETIKALKDTFSMAVCCLDEPGSLAAELTSIGVPLTVLNRQPGFHPSLGRRLAALAREHNAGVLHCHHYTPFVYGCCARAWYRHAQIVFTEHGRLNDAGPSLKRRAANRLLRTVPSAVYAVSHDLSRHMVAEGFSQRQVQVRHNGILPTTRTPDTDRAAARHTLDLPPDAFVIGAVGRLDPVKGLDTLLQAMVRIRLREPRVILVLIGEGPERQRIEDEISRLHLQSVVRLAGFRADVGAIMSAFDVYVNCSTTEGISLTILEAMATALPVVASAVGGTPEIVIDGQTGLLVPARDADALAAAILRVGSLPDGGAALGAAGRARVRAEFSLDQMVNEYARAYLAATT
jgi:glycosyltransferase involved in cell wall biosynthesis